jgi:hypothetical protein
MAKRVELRLCRFGAAGLAAVLVDAGGVSVDVEIDGSDEECECEVRAGTGLRGFVTVVMGSSA